MADETPDGPLTNPARLVLHVIPIGSFLNRSRPDLSNCHALATGFPPITRCTGWRHNTDGFLTFTRGRNPSDAYLGYTQLFHDGVVEAVNGHILQADKNGTFVVGIAYEDEVLQATRRYLDSLKNMLLTPPILIAMALLRCRGALMYSDVHAMSRLQAMGAFCTIDRDVAILPEVTCEDFGADVARLFKPIFDGVWNACGYPGSLNYDEDGNRKPRG